MLLVGALVDFGLASSAQRFVPEYTGLRAFALLRGFLSGSRWMTLAIATLIAGLGALGIRLFEPWISSYEIMPLYLACVAVPMFALSHMQEGIARAYGWVNLALLPPYIVRSVALIVVMALARAAGFATDAATAMMAAVVATWVAGLVQLTMLERRLGRLAIEHDRDVSAIGRPYPERDRVGADDLRTNRIAASSGSIR